ncbi:hypothetical protein HYS99_00635 [Candidatus Giovannonibacteria bacterium]|nr:hypothetical protein [Candidatus Giovannonibacteria bacterium]
MPSYTHIFIDKSDKNLLAQLSKKKEEYEKRLQKDFSTDAQCKLLILKSVLSSERRYSNMKPDVFFVTSNDLKAAFVEAAYEYLWQSPEYRNAFSVVSSYVHGRAHEVAGGTGLPTV